LNHARTLPILTERRLGAEFVLEAHLHSRGAAAALGGSKGGGTGNKGGKDSGLHSDLVVGLGTTRKVRGSTMLRFAVRKIAVRSST
jgi:hypothetical protein